jgi:hypothetical protein
MLPMAGKVGKEHEAEAVVPDPPLPLQFTLRTNAGVAFRDTAKNNVQRSLRIAYLITFQLRVTAPGEIPVAVELHTLKLTAAAPGYG